MAGIRLVEAYLVVEYNEAPTATVTAPTEGGTVATIYPTVTWSYADPEGDPQERYRVKIFSSGQYGAGGFDPDTSAATWDSGIVFSSATSKAVATALTNLVTYRAYVKVADLGSQGRFGPWDFNQFSLSTNPSPAPTLVATAQPTLGRVKLDVAQGAGTPVPGWFEVSDVTGTKRIVRGADHITNSPAGSTFTVYDYEAPIGSVRTYSAVAYRLTGTDTSVSTSTTATATLTATNDWLKDPLDSSRNLNLCVAIGREIRKERLGFTEALGRTRPLAGADTILGWDGELTLLAIDAAERTGIEALLGVQGALLLQTCDGDSRYVRLGPDRTRERVGIGRSTPAFRFTVPFTEVEAP